MKYVYAFSLLLIMMSAAICQDSVSDGLDQQTKPIDIQLFGKKGFTLTGPLDIPIDRSWYTSNVPSNSKYYHYFTDRISIKNSAADVVELVNNYSDAEIAVIAKSYYKNGTYSERFLIQIPAKQTMKLNVTSLRVADGVEFYSISDFALSIGSGSNHQETKDMSAITVLPPMIEKSLAPDDPEELCELQQRAMCVRWRVGLPHCIRIENQANGEGVNASMHFWFTCPGGSDSPMYQKVEVFYPTRDDLFHEALVGNPQYTGPKCNVIGPHDYNDSISYTEPVNDPSLKHQWNRVVGAAFQSYGFGLPFVECIEGSCEGATWLYELSGPGSCQ